MTTVNFMKYFAKSAGISQADARAFLTALDAAIKSYVTNEMKSGDSVKVCDVMYKVDTIPERSGVDYLHGTGTWTKPEHDIVRTKPTKALREILVEE